MSKEQLLDRLNAARERDKQLQRRLEVADEDLMEAKTEQIGVAGDLADASIFIFFKKNILFPPDLWVSVERGLR